MLWELLSDGVRNVAYKFQAGEAVEYSPVGRSVGRFTVVRQMPFEDTDGVRKYRIRSVKEGFERTVSEHDLKATAEAESAYTEGPSRR
jgi:hypothetical protein